LKGGQEQRVLALDPAGNRGHAALLTERRAGNDAWTSDFDGALGLQTPILGDSSTL
jgi:hypothetical protein